MAFGFKSGGRKAGTLNKKTIVRRDGDGKRPGGSYRALETMVRQAEWFQNAADREEAKETPNMDKIEAYRFKSFLIASKIAEYQDPKLSAVRIAGEDGGAIKHEHQHTESATAALEFISGAIDGIASRVSPGNDPSKPN